MFAAMKRMARSSQKIATDRSTRGSAFKAPAYIAPCDSPSGSIDSASSDPVGSSRISASEL